MEKLMTHDDHHPSAADKRKMFKDAAEYRSRSTVRIDDVADAKHKELEEEEDMMSLNERLSMEKSAFILFPDSKRRAVWDLIAFLLILY